MGPCQPGPVFMIIDCPSVDFMSSLECNKQLSRHCEEGAYPTPVIIVHLTPMSVFRSHEYEKWRNRLQLVFLGVTSSSFCGHRGSGPS